MRTYSKPVPGLSALSSPAFVELVVGYQEKLVRTGYSQHVARLHLRSIVHFGVWLELERIDPETISEFLIHRYKADALHYLTPTPDNESQAQAMKRLGIFTDVNTEVGKIIVADVNKERIAELLGADRAACESSSATPHRSPA